MEQIDEYRTTEDHEGFMRYGWREPCGEQQDPQYCQNIEQPFAIKSVLGHAWLPEKPQIMITITAPKESAKRRESFQSFEAMRCFG